MADTKSALSTNRRKRLRLQMALPDVVVEEVERRREDKGHDSHQLHENVEGRTRGILERITDRVADDTGLVGAEGSGRE